MGQKPSPVFRYKILYFVVAITSRLLRLCPTLSLINLILLGIIYISYIIKGDVMGYIINLISDEAKRIRVLKESYAQQLSLLPKGTLRTRRRGNHEYYYLSFRDGEKIITDYVGKDEKRINELKQSLEKRKHVEDILRQLDRELSVAKRILEGEK